MIPWLDDDNSFPPTAQALPADSDAPGLLAAGGELTTERLRSAYQHGIFPWYSPGQPVLWWAPEPRMVLPVAEFRLHRSLRKTLRRFIRTPGCEIRVDSVFSRVIEACARTPRDGQRGTWIVPEMMAAYRRWHLAGVVHSVETWVEGELVGGLYGPSLGRMFYGESMFAWRTDASKIALAALICLCRQHGITLIDCQQHTEHLASFGARQIPREAFEAHLARTTAMPSVEDWTYHASMWRHLGLERADTEDAQT
jgi:leucyl/phenylalanyl-tRNA--protein transferase